MKLQTCSDSPETLAQQIERHVQARTGGMIRDLRVEMSGDDVVLSGRTSTYYNKQLATHAAMEAVEGFSLTNNIEVG